MRLSYDITLRDHREAWWLHIRTDLARRLTVLVLYRALPVLGLFAFYCAWWIWQNEQDTTETIAWIIIGSMWCALALVPSFRIHRLYRQSGMDRGNCNVDISSDSIIVTQPGMVESRYQWRSIQRYVENDRMLLLYLTPVRFLPLPRRAFTAEQYQELQHLLATRLPSASPQGFVATAG
jgi:hypothetical protein